MPRRYTRHQKQQRHSPLRKETHQQHQKDTCLFVLNRIGQQIEYVCGMKENQADNESRTQKVYVGSSNIFGSRGIACSHLLTYSVIGSSPLGVVPAMYRPTSPISKAGSEPYLKLILQQAQCLCD